MKPALPDGHAAACSISRLRLLGVNKGIKRKRSGENDFKFVRPGEECFILDGIGGLINSRLPKSCPGDEMLPFTTGTVCG